MIIFTKSGFRKNSVTQLRKIKQYIHFRYILRICVNFNHSVLSIKTSKCPSSLKVESMDTCGHGLFLNNTKPFAI